MDFSSVLQCDGYEAYDCFARRRGEAIVLAGCLAHVRRKFYYARETAPKVAGWFLKHFQNLYALEAKLRNARVGPKLRQAERAGASRPVLARLHRALVRLKIQRRFLPRSLMGQAIDYALNQWSSLLLFLEDGRLEIDNNLIAPRTPCTSSSRTGPGSRTGPDSSRRRAQRSCRPTCA